MNHASASGKKKQSGLSRQEVSNSNPFDALNTIENNDDPGTNGEDSKLAEKGGQFITRTHPTNFGLLKKFDYPVNTDSDSEVVEMFNETAGFMASTSSKVENNFSSGSGVGSKSMYEQRRETYVEYPYDVDDFDDYGFTDFLILLISVSVQLRRVNITKESGDTSKKEVEPNEKTQADNKKDKTVMAFLYQALSEEQLLQITKYKTAKTIWDALKTRHIGEERIQQARLQTLKSDFEMIHIKEDETIDTFTTKQTTLVNKAAKAIGRLKTYEVRIKYKKGKQVDNQEKLMFTRHENKGKYFKGRGRGKHRFSQERNHENFKGEKKDGETSHRSYNKNNFKKSNYDTSKLRCYKCKEIGHIAPKCPQKKKSNEQSNLIEEDLEPTLLMAILEDEEEQNVSLQEEDVGYKEINKDSLNEQGSKAYRLFDPTTQRICVSRDVKFKENETWDWKDYMSELINDEPEWTDFRIGDLEATNEHHDQGFQPIEEDNELPNNDDDDYVSPTRDSPLHSQTPHTPSTSSSQVNSQVTPNISTQSYYQSDNDTIQTINSPSHFDHTSIKGFRTLNDLYENTEELLLAEDEPKNYKEASNDQKWIEAMKAELDFINRNNTWKLTTLPKGHKAIGLKWVFKTKRDANGNIIKHKARLVAKGYIQEHDIDFEEVFAPVAKMETIRLLLAIAANNKWEKQDQGKVYRLIKALYGLRQAPRAWNIKLDNTLKSLDFKKCALEQAIYIKTSKDSTLLIGVYVDDLIITGTPKKEIDKFKAQMEEKFEMSDLGLLAYYLGIEVTQTNGDISIKQSAYASKILKEAGMIDCNETLIPMDPGTRLTKITEGTMVNSTEYRSLIGCLRYLLHTRPDLSYSVGLLSRSMQEPREQHMKAIKQVLRYVKGTKDYGITYMHNEGNKIHGYSDSSYGVNTTEGKGTTGIIFYYGESPISWSTQKQATVALSSCESEFIAATAATTQALWLKRLLSKLTHTQEEKVTIQVDNKSAIALMKNPVFHGRSKHIDTKYHFIRECVERNDIQVEFVSGEYQKADILTKALPKIKFLTMRQLIGLKDLSHSACD
ncbi:ribonuclease H-like domain, reverse transcriptase, RNA-dependent DNA polymerase [Tanacetum coccineum]